MERQTGRSDEVEGVERVVATMWHGGAPGREVGDELLPPDETGFVLTNAVLTGPLPVGKRRAYRRDRVYATTDREFAEVWAEVYSEDPNRPGDGLVYEVELDGAVLDDDFPSSGTSYEATRGRIVSAGLPVDSATSRLSEVLERYRREGDEANAKKKMDARIARRKRTAKEGRRSNVKRLGNRRKK
jgi:hypothetical protein